MREYMTGITVSQFDWNYYLPSFAPTELYSPILLQHNLLHTLDIESACKLQRFRDRIFDLTKQGIVVNGHGHTRRGVRAIEDQLAIIKQTEGAEILSMHCQGKAFDCSLANWGTYTPEWLADQAKVFGFGGVGTYKSAGFVHVDTRLNHDGTQTLWTRA